jgi:CBS domain-containing protein
MEGRMPEGLHNIATSKSDLGIIQQKEALPFLTAKEYLVNTTVKELFPENRTRIIWVDSTTVVATAFKILNENKILSLPVFDSKHEKYFGFIDMLDIVCHCFPEIKQEDSQTDIDSDKLLKSMTEYTCGQVAGTSGRNPYYPIDENTSLLTAIDLMLTYQCHRLPVVDKMGQLTSLISQSLLVNAILSNLGKFNQIKNRTVAELNIGIKTVIGVNVNDRAIDAFKLLYDKKILGVAVVDNAGSLVGNISASDLKQIGDTHIIARLLVPSSKFIELIPKSEDQLPGPYYVKPAATVEEVFTKINITRSHRIYVLSDTSNVPFIFNQ